MAKSPAAERLANATRSARLGLMLHKGATRAFRTARTASAYDTAAECSQVWQEHLTGQLESRLRMPGESQHEMVARLAQEARDSTRARPRSSAPARTRGGR